MKAKKPGAMQWQSYFPLYYTHNDLVVDANGSTGPMYTGHATPPTGHFTQRFMNLQVNEGYHLGFDKEFLRQTILQQEVTFKDQVQELHRLYRRQRELLDEIKRNNFYKKNVLSEAQWSSNSLTSHVSFNSDQKAARGFSFDTLAFSQPSSQASKNVRSSSILDLSLSSSNIARRNPLDLQLPADEYINNEGKESSNNFAISGMSIWSTHTSNRACPLAPSGNMTPLFVSSSPTTFSSQMIDLAKFSGSKHMCSGTFNDFPDKKKLKTCKDIIEADSTDVWQRWQPRDEDGKSRGSLNSSGWYSYSESLQRLAEAGQAHQTAPLFTKKDDRLGLENGRRHTDAKILGSIHGMLNLYTPGQVNASHRPILESQATHSSKVNSRVPLSSSCGQVDLTLRENFISPAVSCLSPHFSAIKTREPCVDGLDYSSRSNVKASSVNSGFLFQNYECDLVSADSEAGKSTNRLGSIDLNCTGVAVLDGDSANSVVSREKVDDLTSPELVSSQVSASSSVVLNGKHVGASKSPHMPVILDPSGSCEETTLLGSSNVDQGPTRQGGKSRLFDMNLPCHLTADTVRLEDDPVVDDPKHSDLINLDCNVKDDDQISPSSASSKQVAEVVLEAPIIPVTPEKQESRRPRGESEENKTEMSLPLSTREDGESMDELMKIAVDVLVSISSEAQHNSAVSEHCQISSNELLVWFAGVVCSAEHGNGLVASNSTGIDYFEAMTLKLTETAEEDYWPNTVTLHTEKETSDAPFSAESSRSGRTPRRVKRKNFQREVLPSLASLSRYEVSEDIQFIEMLMEANGTPLQLGVKMRKLGRKRRVRGRKKMRITATTTATTTTSSRESRICLLALPQMAIRAIDLKDKGRVRWENTSRQPRGKRHRTGFPDATLSQDGWMRKWGGIGFVHKGKKKLKKVEMLVTQVGSS